jgi:hypothetical protein
MRPWLEDSRHLVRMAGLFAVGIVVFLVLQQMLVPPGFGRDGHYRPAALDDNRARPIRYAGRAACADCHADVVEARRGGRHEGIGCEACHGPLAAHAASPGDVVPRLPDGRAVCLRCHLANMARPASFPQITVPEHSESGLCTECHQAHSPGLS